MSFRVALDKKDDRWRWWTSMIGFRLELYLPTVSEVQQAMGRYQNDQRRFNRFFAENWFRDFAGLEDSDGQMIPNTLENRILLLDEPVIQEFVHAKLRRAEEWGMEKNADGGSAC